ncbi:RadC family protein [Psychrobacter alimentarius]|uniref:DNA repair protein RadC n=1 Tax=Psychrobacter alimentarius TaxID=261164 RepID=A0ABM6A0R0_9GAMM|nr:MULTISPECIES: DNA repair protein RadC [Psychrobacter]AMT97936.1 DNA repair protein RadC [Psychrobacter alimentarius]PAT62791.1 JAB domain-containing protein [Psychrobacter sp. JB193]QCB29788.1 JAB domain-containing protein [Psychrobacter sp. PAMC27889]
MAIKDWHEEDRPREKLLKFGATHLTDAEILAIFLRTGTQSQSAIELARHLIEKFGSLAELLAAPQDIVLGCHGMGPAKYAQILASLEMGTRYLDSKLKTGQALGRSQVVKDYISTQLRGEHREVFAVLCLDNGLKLLDFEILFTGGISSCSVCIKHVLRHALSHATSQLIVAHNHPNTDAKPSTADNLLTYELKKACDLLDIALVDHIIVGRNDTLSYAESGLAPFN